MSDPLSRFHAVIPAGGAGTRLWPLSRAGSPKFLHDLSGSGHTLIQDTVARLRPLVGERIFIVTGVRHAEAIRAQLPDVPAAAVLVEPTPRDSMAAIGLAAAVLEARDPDAILGSFAADHVVIDQSAFQECIREAKAAGRTVLLSSHILAQVEVLADRISIIRKGRIVESGSLNDLRHLSRTAVTAQTARPVEGLSSRAGVHDLREEAGQIRFDVDTQHLPEVMRELSSHGVEALTATPPTLEQLLLRHYGDELQRSAS